MMIRKHSWLLPSLSALMLWGLSTFLPKLAMQSMSPQSVIFWEALGNMIVTIPILFFLKGKLVMDKKAVTITAAGACFSIVAILAYYYALRLGPVATIVTITAMYPVVVLILARIFLHEKLNRTQLLAVGMAMGAIWLLAG